VISPLQIFEDNIRPAELMLKVYRLLHHDAPQSDGELVQSLRSLVNANSEESLLVIYNEVFLGLIRERAQILPSTLRIAALSNLLRQAVVSACTALETYLPALLTRHLDEVIRYKGRGFIPSEPEIATQCRTLTFSIDEVVRLLNDPDPFFVANKLVGHLKHTYLTGARGVQVTGLLLSIPKPWAALAKRLNRDDKELRKTIETTVSRRNDIVHRADRSELEAEVEQQEITYSLAHQAVETIRVVCLCLDEIVAERLTQLRQGPPVLAAKE
jgi:hypothetical protein